MFLFSQTDDHSMIMAKRPLMAATWAPFSPKGPICAPVETIVNRTISKGRFLPARKVAGFCKKELLELGANPETSIMLLTTVPQEALVHRTQSEAQTGLRVEVLCTAGLGNGVAPGDSALYNEELEQGRGHQPGTINIITLVNRQLSPAALLELTQVVTMAKCQALFGFGKLSKPSGRIVLGTGTDCQVVAGFVEHPVYLQYAGLSVRLGELTARAVEDAVFTAVTQQRDCQIRLG